MHEFSIVQSLLRTIGRYAAEHSATEVSKVIVRVGPLSGVVPHLLRTAFDTFKEGTVAEKAELCIKEEAMRLHCDDCGRDSGVSSPMFRCQHCGSLRVKACNGDELILERLEMECP